MKKTVLFALTIVICCMWTDSLLGQNFVRGSYTGPVDAAMATVKITAGTFDGERNFHEGNSGSGVIISSDGLIITARRNLYHPQTGTGQQYPEIWVGLPGPNGEMLRSNRAYRARLIAGSEASALAVLKISPNRFNEKFAFLNLGETGDLHYGQTLNVTGYAAANGGSVSRTRVSVVGLDEADDWLKVEGPLLRGMLGGTLVDGKNRLIGIPVKIARGYPVPFFDENNEAVGQISLEEVGFVCSAEAIRQFLLSVPNLIAFTVPGEIRQSVEIGGAVVDKKTNQPIRWATIGVLVPDAVDPVHYVGLDELIAYGRTDARGAFKLNRRIKPGNYIVKIVHPGYRTEIKRVQLPNSNGHFYIELTSER